MCFPGSVLFSVRGRIATLCKLNSFLSPLIEKAELSITLKKIIRSSYCRKQSTSCSPSLSTSVHATDLLISYTSGSPLGSYWPYGMCCTCRLNPYKYGIILGRGLVTMRINSPTMRTALLEHLQQFSKLSCHL